MQSLGRWMIGQIDPKTKLMVSALVFLVPVSLVISRAMRDVSAERRAEKDIKVIMAVVKAFRAKNGGYPYSLEILTEPRWNDGQALLKKEALLNPWGQPYIVECSCTNHLVEHLHVYAFEPESPCWNRLASAVNGIAKFTGATFRLEQTPKIIISSWDFEPK
jgi:Type II secretion system (T2SS), protein G